MRTSLGGFVAGTPVHTRHGLVPIERLKPGDLVLSREDGQDAPTYHPVRALHRHEDAALFRLRVRAGQCACDLLLSVEQRLRTGSEQQPAGRWRRARRLEPGGIELLAHHGGRVQVEDVGLVWRTRTHGVGWINADSRHYSAPHGWRVDLRPTHGPVHDPVPTPNDHSAWLAAWDGSLECEHTLKHPVHVLELEDARGYFVGELGVWVRG